MHHAITAWLQAPKVKAAVAQPLMTQPQRQLQPQQQQQQATAELLRSSLLVMGKGLCAGSIKEEVAPAQASPQPL